MKILIAGASGFIGKSLTESLKSKYQIQQLSLRDKSWKIQIDEPAVFINLVGKAHDHKGLASKEDFFFANLELTKELFECFQQSNAKLFIHISSIAAVEEIGSTATINEETLCNPYSNYGKSKRAAEEYLLSQEFDHDKRLIILRPSMVHGPGDKGNLALLIKFVQKGIHYPLGAYNNSRSFLGIDNLCFAIEKLILNKIPNGIYDVVDDDPLSTTSIIQHIAYLNAKKPKIVRFPKFLINLLAKTGDVFKLPLNTKRLKKLTSNLVVSNNKLKNELGITKFPLTSIEGLTKTIESFVDTSI